MYHLLDTSKHQRRLSNRSLILENNAGNSRARECKQHNPSFLSRGVKIALDICCGKTIIKTGPGLFTDLRWFGTPDSVEYVILFAVHEIKSVHLKAIWLGKRTSLQFPNLYVRDFKQAASW